VKNKNRSSDNITIDVKEMKTSHVVLICFIIFAVTSYTVLTLNPLIQQDNDLLEEKTPLNNSLNILLKEKPGLIKLGDPIEDPIPRKR
jgi:heme-binding NEAT domain protein